MPQFRLHDVVVFKGTTQRNQRALQLDSEVTFEARVGRVPAMHLYYMLQPVMSTDAAWRGRIAEDFAANVMVGPNDTPTGPTNVQYQPPLAPQLPMPWPPVQQAPQQQQQATPPQQTPRTHQAPPQQQQAAPQGAIAPPPPQQTHQAVPQQTHPAAPQQTHAAPTTQAPQQQQQAAPQGAIAPPPQQQTHPAAPQQTLAAPTTQAPQQQQLASPQAEIAPPQPQLAHVAAALQQTHPAAPQMHPAPILYQAPQQPAPPQAEIAPPQPQLAPVAAALQETHPVAPQHPRVDPAPAAREPVIPDGLEWCHDHRGAQQEIEQEAEDECREAETAAMQTWLAGACADAVPGSAAAAAAAAQAAQAAQQAAHAAAAARQQMHPTAPPQQQAPPQAPIAPPLPEQTLAAAPQQTTHGHPSLGCGLGDRRGGNDSSLLGEQLTIEIRVRDLEVLLGREQRRLVHVQRARELGFEQTIHMQRMLQADQPVQQTAIVALRAARAGPSPQVATEMEAAEAVEAAEAAAEEPLAEVVEEVAEEAAEQASDRAAAEAAAEAAEEIAEGSDDDVDNMPMPIPDNNYAIAVPTGTAAEVAVEVAEDAVEELTCLVCFEEIGVVSCEDGHMQCLGCASE